VTFQFYLEEYEALFLLLFLWLLLWLLAWLFLFRFFPEEIKEASPLRGLNWLCPRWYSVVISFGTDIGPHRFGLGHLFPNVYRVRCGFRRLFVLGSRLGKYIAIFEID